MDSAVVTFVVALSAGVITQSIAKHLRIPGVVLLLVVGVGLGPEWLGWVEPRSLGEGLLDIVELAVAVILFEGGLNLEFSRLVRSQTAIRRLVTWGVLITGVGATVVAHFLLDWPWLLASLFGSLVTVTGPTVIGPLVRELRLRPRVATVLEAEGVLIDPIGAILAVLVLEVALTLDADTLAIGGRAVLMQLGFGTFAGLFGGLCLAGLLRFRRIVPDGYENIVALASILLLFVASNVLVPQSGILAVPVAGVVVGNMRTRVDRDLREFKDQLSVLLIGLLFVLLAADVRIAEIEALGVPGALTVAVLVFVVRPLNVAICTAGSDLTVRERMLVAWGGARQPWPRGRRHVARDGLHDDCGNRPVGGIYRKAPRPPARGTPAGAGDRWHPGNPRPRAVARESPARWGAICRLSRREPRTLSTRRGGGLQRRVRQCTAGTLAAARALRTGGHSDRNDTQ
ncbi:MAG: sodium:proton antiporter [Deltaproteobacteria bacterium]|nr:sodium:proton antiporter [Deltaproteobacteria bacterium]